MTTGVQGKPEPKARWTHLAPDSRLVALSSKQPDLPDMYLMHVDDIHFDLIVHKDSDLATEGSLDEGRTVQEEAKTKPTPTVSEKDEEVLEEAKTKPTVSEMDEVVEVEPSGDDTAGPGYMGWTVDDKVENEQKPYQKKVEELQQAYNELKVDFEELKAAYEKAFSKLETEDPAKTGELDDSKSQKKLNNEVRNIKIYISN